MARRNVSPPPPYDQGCPHCGAPAGYGCVRPNGSPLDEPHAKRYLDRTQAPTRSNAPHDDELHALLDSLPQDAAEDDVADLPEHLRVLLAESFAALREQLAAEARRHVLTAAQRQALQAQLTKLKQLADRQRAFSVGAQRNLTAAQRDALRELARAELARREAGVGKRRVPLTKRRER